MESNKFSLFYLFIGIILKLEITECWVQFYLRSIRTVASGPYVIVYYARYNNSRHELQQTVLSGEAIYYLQLTTLRLVNAQRFSRCLHRKFHRLLCGAKSSAICC